MKGWHIGCILLIVVAYLVGIKYPGPGAKVWSLIGQ